MKKKALRIYPIVMISVIIEFYVSIIYLNRYGLWIEKTKIYSLWELVESLLLIYDTLSPDVMVYHRQMWYLCVLLVCYVLFWLVNKIAKKNNMVPVYGYIFVALIGVLVQLNDISLPFLNQVTDRGYICFFVERVCVKYTRDIRKYLKIC